MTGCFEDKDDAWEAWNNRRYIIRGKGIKMRQKLNAKKTLKIRKETGLPVIAVLVRGNTCHRKDLCLEDGTIACLWPDGSIEKTDYKHNVRSVLES